MPNFKVAHIRQQGVDLIIVPVGAMFGQKPVREQSELIDEMQAAATSAGLAGTVVPVWNIGNRMTFIAPTNWHPFFKGISWDDVLSNVNVEISC